MVKKDYWNIKDVRRRLKERLLECGFRVNVDDAQIIIESVLDCIVDGLVENGEVRFEDFGKFSQQLQKERFIKNQNIKGGSMVSPAHGVVHFKPFKRLKDVVYLYEENV